MIKRLEPMRLFDTVITAFALLGALALGGCAAPGAPTVDNQARPFAQAVEHATDALVAQLDRASTGLIGQMTTRTLVLDPTLDAASGQQTVATQQLDKALGERIASQYKKLQLLPFRAASLGKARYLMLGTLAREQGAFRLNLALVDLKTGLGVAQASAVAQAQGIDMSPLAYYRDSPVLLKDRVVDGYVRSSSTVPGQKADPVYLERIAQATVIDDANSLYNDARYEEALGQYRSALAMPAGEQIRVLNGIYLSSVKLGKMDDAEKIFGRLVAFGIEHKQLGVKILFNPDSTDFWSDPAVSSVYDMWLRQIAQASAQAKDCMLVVGHTSKTGTEAYNDALSLKRAVSIRQRLGQLAPEVAQRTQVKGMGFHENIIGSGTDDGVDALDRRVEFKVVACGGSVSAAATAPRSAQ